jgi:hypothetical protein
MKVGACSIKYTVILSERSESKDPRFRLLYVTFNGAEGFSPLNDGLFAGPSGPELRRFSPAISPLRQANLTRLSKKYTVA